VTQRRHQATRRQRSWFLAGYYKRALAAGGGLVCQRCCICLLVSAQLKATRWWLLSTAALRGVTARLSAPLRAGHAAQLRGGGKCYRSITRGAAIRAKSVSAKHRSAAQALAAATAAWRWHA